MLKSYYGILLNAPKSKLLRPALSETLKLALTVSFLALLTVFMSSTLDLFLCLTLNVEKINISACVINQDVLDIHPISMKMTACNESKLTSLTLSAGFPDLLEVI